MDSLFLMFISLMFTSLPVFAGTDKDVEAGEFVYVQCTGCHSPDYHRTGPKHCGVLGRLAGSVAEFNFSPAMKESGITWTRTELNRFLQSPLEVIPGTSMGYSGIDSALERRQLIAYLASLDTDNPLCR